MHIVYVYALYIAGVINIYTNSIKIELNVFYMISRVCMSVCVESSAENSFQFKVSIFRIAYYAKRIILMAAFYLNIN